MKSTNPAFRQLFRESGPVRRVRNVADQFLLISGGKRGAIVLLFVTVACSMFLISSAQSQQGRPKIGLVLKGGGALGFAHVGVLKVLERNRVPVDLPVPVWDPS